MHSWCCQLRCPALPGRAAAAAGAVLVAKTNLDQFAAGLVGTRSPYGTALNAFDDRRAAAPAASSCSAHMGWHSASEVCRGASCRLGLLARIPQSSWLPEWRVSGSCGPAGSSLAAPLLDQAAWSAAAWSPLRWARIQLAQVGAPCRRQLLPAATATAPWPCAAPAIHLQTAETAVPAARAGY